MSRREPCSQKSEKNELAGRRVLIVEDEYFLADDFRQILADYGAEVLGPVATLGVELGALIVAHEAPVGDQLS
jgi:superfamily II helicase